MEISKTLHIAKRYDSGDKPEPAAEILKIEIGLRDDGVVVWRRR